MKETVTDQFGFRRPDGKVIGWWRYRADRERAVEKFAEDFRRMTGDNPRVGLVTKRVTTTERLTTERTVKA